MTVRMDRTGIHQLPPLGIEGLSDGPEAADEAAKEATHAETRAAGFREIMSTQIGRLVLAEALIDMRVFHPVAGERQAGAQEAGMRLRDWLREAGPAYWRKLCEENEL